MRPGSVCLWRTTGEAGNGCEPASRHDGFRNAARGDQDDAAGQGDPREAEPLSDGYGDRPAPRDARPGLRDLRRRARYRPRPDAPEPDAAGDDRRDDPEDE